jgi:hypothetical protein
MTDKQHPWMGHAGGDGRHGFKCGVVDIKDLPFTQHTATVREQSNRLNACSQPTDAQHTVGSRFVRAFGNDPDWLEYCPEQLYTTATVVDAPRGHVGMIDVDKIIELIQSTYPCEQGPFLFKVVCALLGATLPNVEIPASLLIPNDMAAVVATEEDIQQVRMLAQIAQGWEQSEDEDPTIAVAQTRLQHALSRGSDNIAEHLGCLSTEQLKTLVVRLTEENAKLCEVQEAGNWGLDLEFLNLSPEPLPGGVLEQPLPEAVLEPLSKAPQDMAEPLLEPTPVSLPSEAYWIPFPTMSEMHTVPATFQQQA